MPQELTDRAIGCMLGLAVGDAIGDLGRSDSHRQRYGIITSMYDGAKSTDDTEFAVLTAQTLLDCRGQLTLEHLVASWRKYILAQGGMGTRGGKPLYGAVANLERGLLPPMSGSDNVQNDDDGAVMRIAPVGILCAGDPKRAAELAAIEACISHARDGIWGAQAVAASVALAMVGASVDEIIAGGLEYLPHDSWLGRTMARAMRICDENPTIEEAWEALHTDLWTPVHSTVAEALPQVYAVFRLTGGDFRKGMFWAANFGRDADTISAVVGAFSGAMHGESVIPPDWREKVRRPAGVCLKFAAAIDICDIAFFWDNNWFPQALDLTPYLTADGVNADTFIKGFWDTRAVWQGKPVGLPLGVGANFVMYNKDLFDAAGIAYPTADWTTDQYNEIAAKLTNPDKKVWGGDRPRGPFRAIWNNYGAFPYSDDSKTVEGYLNSDASVAAYTWLWDLVNSGATPTPADLEVLSKEGTGPIDLFLANRIAMATLNQGHMLNALKSGVNFGIVPEPKAPGTDRYVNAWSLTVSIWKGTEHPDEAWKFLSYWAGPQGQKYLMDNGNLIPSIESVQAEFKDAQTEAAQSFFSVLQLRQVAEWDNAHPCKSTVLRAAVDVWDLINLGSIGRDEIKAKLDSLVAPAQAALDECRGRLGG